ncbi:MAG TPA: protein kinase [Elusimicrobiota bacterium]|nr:protein kinase [Elusimicrobiota bacterium]
MSRHSLRPLLAVVLVLAAAVASQADPRGILPKDLPEATRRQFEALAAGAQGDAVKLKTIALTRELFVKAVTDPNKLPQDIRFRPNDVEDVGQKINALIGGVYKYQKQQIEIKALVNAGRYDDAKTLSVTSNAELATTVNSANFAPKMGMPSDTAHELGNTLEHRERMAEHPDREWHNGPENTTSPETEPFLDKSHGPEGKRTESDIAGAGADNNGEILGKLIKDIVSQAVKPPTPDPVVPGGTGGSSNIPQPAPSPSPAPVAGGGNGGAPNVPPGVPTGITPIRDALGVTDPSSPGDAMINARERYSGGDVAGGLQDATRAIQLGGGAPAYAMRGGMELDQREYPKATADAKSALQLDPSNREAMAVYQLSKVGPPSIEVPGAAGRSSAAGAAAGAESESAAAQIAAATSNAARMSGADAKKEAMNAMKLGDVEGALVYVNRALSQNPNSPELLNIRAAINARRRDYDSAIADAKAGLALAPKNKTLLKTLGYAQLRGKRYKDAEATASEMLSIDPENPYAFALRAHAEANLGDKDAMMADINRAASLDPAYQPAAAELAKLVQLPTDQDTFFLFPGEVASAAKTAAPAAPARGRTFGALAGAAALGGLLLALGLMKTVMAPLTERITSAFTRRSGPGAAAATEESPSVNGLMPGLIRGQYRISRQIGAGGMGMVFEGTDRSLGRRVAIKKMRDELRVNPQERARFVIEAKTVAALHHANIVDIYAIAEEGADVFLIFEYVDGKTAHELVQASGRLPLAQAARVVRSAADALDYAHAHGVIHRDMKPSNVMIDSTGRVKVMDFGIARMAKDSMTRYSMTNTVVGTTPYMAPEQEQGQVRKESDVYALAVCAYEMITGKLPFIGIGAGMLMNKINMSYVAPSRAIAGVPEALDPVFQRAFQADPDKRFRTPKEFADAFESARGAAASAA